MTASRKHGHRLHTRLTPIPGGTKVSSGRYTRFENERRHLDAAPDSKRNDVIWTLHQIRQGTTSSGRCTRFDKERRGHLDAATDSKRNDGVIWTLHQIRKGTTSSGRCNRFEKERRHLDAAPDSKSGIDGDIWTLQARNGGQSDVIFGTHIVQFSSVQFKMVFLRSGKITCVPLRLS